MKKSNFVITGYGRSGTKFLANTLNQSEQWTIKHEPRGDIDEKAYRKGKQNKQYHLIKNDLSIEYYSEVNSYLRFYLKQLVKEFETGVIIRDPKKILTSVMNRKNYDKRYKFYITDLYNVYSMFEHLNENILLIDFKKMVKDKAYLQHISKHFGIMDLKIKDINLEKKNKNKQIKYNDFNNLPDDIKFYYYETFGKFYDINDVFKFKIL